MLVEIGVAMTYRRQRIKTFSIAFDNLIYQKVFHEKNKEFDPFFAYICSEGGSRSNFAMVLSQRNNTWALSNHRISRMERCFCFPGLILEK